MADHAIGDLAEVLDHLGVFRAHPEDVAELCPSGFRRVPISTGPDYYLSLQILGPDQVPLGPGVVVGRGAKHPHGFTAGPGGLQLLSVQLPRPEEGATTWDEPGESTDPIHCAAGGQCRRCPRCGGPSATTKPTEFRCENCDLRF